MWITKSKRRLGDVMEIRGINSEKVKEISRIKKEDKWVEEYRLDSFSKFEKITTIPHC